MSLGQDENPGVKSQRGEDDRHSGYSDGYGNAAGVNEDVFGVGEIAYGKGGTWWIDHY